jgi:hypothetical protein
MVGDAGEKGARRFPRKLGRERARGVEERREQSLRLGGRREAGRVSKALS